MKQISRTSRIHFRVTEDEHEKIKERADLAGLSISEYIRKCALGCRVVAKSELNVIKELRHQGGLIKHLYNESHGMYSTEMANALNAITSCVHAIERAIS